MLCIEISSTAVKLQVIDATRYRDKLPGVDPREDAQANTTLLKSVGADGHFGANALKETAAHVASFLKQATEEFGVPPAQVYVVCGSGAFSKIKDSAQKGGARRNLVEENQDLLTAAIADEVNLPVDFLAADEEMRRAFSGVVPPDLAGEALFLDIGGGSTKGSSQFTRSMETFETPFGAKSFTEAVKAAAPKARRTLANQARFQANLVAQELKARLDDKPGMKGKSRVYLGGGIVWAMATYTHPGERSPFVELTGSDLQKFLDLAAKGRDTATKKIMSATADEAYASTELEKVHGVFNAEQMLAGSELIKAYWHELSLDKKKIYFARYALMGWQLDYLRDKAADDVAATR